ncbi:MAG: indole-3-glycerol phosphate synthase TrpC [Elusimicrobia bacterium]|nr:indole-3-glycerol phosphate synthase TrpC [Elusimicrobiota bacterium]
MEGFLTKILAEKKESVLQKRAKLPLSKLQEMLKRVSPARNFKEAISKKSTFNIIGEIKKASPSAGIIRPLYDAGKLAKELADGGVSAISVLTEEKHFHGDLFHLIRAYDSMPIPILRKDFIIDEYQIFEARAYFADAVLLIAELLSEQQLCDYLAVCKSIGLSALVELHNENQIDKVIKANPDIIGINNRNLDDFSVDISSTFKIKKKLPEGKIVVSESGIKTKYDIFKLKDAGINAALIGETLMRAENIKSKLIELIM